MIVSKQVSDTEIFAFIAILVFQLLSRTFLFIKKRKLKRLKSRLLFMEISDMKKKCLNSKLRSYFYIKIH